MKNKLIIILVFIINNLFEVSYANTINEFNFDITEIEILENGNKFLGKKGGTVITTDGLKINANNFEFNKKENILVAYGKVEVFDSIKNLTLFTDKLKYFKNIEKIVSTGKTLAFFDSKYSFETKNVSLLRNEDKLSSKYRGLIKDNEGTTYEFENYVYLVKEEILKANDVLISLYKKDKQQTDLIELKNGFFDLQNKSFVASETKISLDKNTFDESENDPRLSGVSSRSSNDITIIEKGVFTSCKKTDGCPPWSIESRLIKHDKQKKQIIYDHAVLRLYDFPILYYPKFFHPDPSVKRQSGFLKPQFNNSDILGSSLYLPYFKAISNNKDLTFKPTLFGNGTFMIQNEFRSVKKFSSFITDFGITKDYKSATSNKDKSIAHFFSNYNLDLNLDKFFESELNLSIEKINNDNFLKVFDNNLGDNVLKPQNSDILNSNLEITLDHEKYNLTGGISVYENLQLRNSDRYQYILPYYNFNKNFSYNGLGAFNFTSDGNNNLSNTNILKSNVNNNLEFSSNDYFTNAGFQNNLNFFLKNNNTVGKNDSVYKSSAQSEVTGIFELKSSFPLYKIDDKYGYSLTPKISLRANPTDMKNYSNSKKNLSTSNLFNINRLGLGDTLEGGKSLTIGLDYNRKSIVNDKFINLELATVLRDKINERIPSSSTLNKKNSHIFGSLETKLMDNLNLNYNFMLDNDLKTLDYNSISANFSINNLVTTFNFIKEKGVVGNSDIFENGITYNIDTKNNLKFATRRNREINLTEFYDLIYEYKIDCLTAGFKYRKTYYEDRDLKPNEDFLFTITLFPLTTYEYDLGQNIN